MISAPAPLARPGDVVRLAVEDYLYGDAPVTVRVVGIDAGLDRIPGLEWVRILAVDVAAPNGEPYPIIARATALRRPTSTSTTGHADRRTAPHSL